MTLFNKLKIGFFFFSLLSLMSCGDEAIPVELEIMLFEKITPTKAGFYPTFYEEILSPLTVTGENKSIYSFNPVTISRKDLNNEFLLEYMTNTATNYEKVKAVEKSVRDFYKTNQVDSILQIQGPANAYSQFTTYLANRINKDNLIIFSEEEVKLNQGIAYTSMQSLRKAISEYLSINPENKITIAIAPTQVHLPQPPQPGTPITNDRDLTAIFQKLTDLNISKSDRNALIPQILTQYFSPNATIEPFGKNGAQLPAESAQEYFDKIIFYLTLDSIQVRDVKLDREGKYETVHVIEHHKTQR